MSAKLAGFLVVLAVATAPGQQSSLGSTCCCSTRQSAPRMTFFALPTASGSVASASSMGLSATPSAVYSVERHFRDRHVLA